MRDVDAAHLLRLKPGSLPRDAHAGAAAGQEVPTLEAFRESVNPDALYVETYPPATPPALDRKVARNRRLRDRLDAALARMEASLVEAPQPEHALNRWFDALLFARLEAAGITTFAELLAHLRELSGAGGAIRRCAATFCGVFAEGADRVPRFSCAFS